MSVKVGDKIRIIHMEGEPDYTYKEGAIDHIDDAGQLHCKEFGLAIIPDADIFEVIESV